MNPRERSRIISLGVFMTLTTVFLSGVVVGSYRSRATDACDRGLIEYLAAPPLDPCSAEWIRARATEYAIEKQHIPTPTPKPSWGPEQRA